MRKYKLVFDTEILIDDNKDGKVLFDLYIGGKKQTKRISTKILKMDESHDKNTPIWMYQETRISSKFG